MGGGITTNTVQQIATYIYDGSGQVLTVSNAIGEKTVTTSDALGRPTRVETFSRRETVPSALPQPPVTAPTTTA